MPNTQRHSPWPQRVQCNARDRHTNKELKSSDMTNTHTCMVAQRKVINFFMRKNSEYLFHLSITWQKEGRILKADKRSKRFQKAFYITRTLSNVVKVKLAQSCSTLCDPVDCTPPGSSVHGILQARILEWVAISFSRGSSWPRDWTQLSCTAGRHFNLWATREDK